MPDASLIGLTLAGRFRLTGIIGHGGMATVYRGVEEGKPGNVAIKLMNAELASDSRFVRRFRREAKAASMLKHPNSVSILEFGVDQGHVFLAMECLEGSDLALLLHREKRVSERRAVQIVVQVCAALAAAHELSIIHRDLKPDNIMLVKPPDDRKPDVEGLSLTDYVKVLDFGIAKILDEDGQVGAAVVPATDDAAEPDTAAKSLLTRVGTIVGTPAYMSPEQGRAEPVDGRTDVYACGVLLYELITGRVPFTGETPMQVVMRHVNEPPLPPSKVVPIDTDLEAIIMKALAKWPNERHRRALDLANSLRNVLPRLSAQKRGRHESGSGMRAPTRVGLGDAESGTGTGVEKKRATISTPAPEPETLILDDSKRKRDPSDGARAIPPAPALPTSTAASPAAPPAAAPRAAAPQTAAPQTAAPQAAAPQPGAVPPAAKNTAAAATPAPILPAKAAPIKGKVAPAFPTLHLELPDDIGVDSKQPDPPTEPTGATESAKAPTQVSPVAPASPPARSAERSVSPVATGKAASPTAKSSSGTLPAATLPTAPTSPAATSPAATSPAATSPAGTSTATTASPSPRVAASPKAVPTATTANESAPAPSTAEDDDVDDVRTLAREVPQSPVPAPLPADAGHPLASTLASAAGESAAAVVADAPAPPSEPAADSDDEPKTRVATGRASLSDISPADIGPLRDASGKPSTLPSADHLAGLVPTVARSGLGATIRQASPSSARPLAVKTTQPLTSGPVSSPSPPSALALQKATVKVDAPVIPDSARAPDTARSSFPDLGRASIPNAAGVEAPDRPSGPGPSPLPVLTPSPVPLVGPTTPTTPVPTRPKRGRSRLSGPLAMGLGIVIGALLFGVLATVFLLVSR